MRRGAGRWFAWTRTCCLRLFKKVKVSSWTKGRDLIAGITRILFFFFVITLVVVLSVILELQLLKDLLKLMRRSRGTT